MNRAARKEPWSLLVPALALLAVGFVVPVAGMLAASVQGPDGGLSLANFERMVESEYAMQAAWRSARLGLIQTVFAVALALPIAYIMSRVSAWLRTSLLVIVVLPLMTSVVVRTFGWVVIMSPTGPLGSLLGGAGGQGLLGTELGVVIAMVQVLLPYGVLSILAVMSNVRPQLEEASRTLGAGFWSTMRHVVLPLSAPGIAAAASLVFVLSVSSFITPRFIGGPQIPVFAQTIYVDATTNLDWPYAAAQAVLLFAGVMLVLVSTARIGHVKGGSR